MLRVLVELSVIISQPLVEVHSVSTGYFLVGLSLALAARISKQSVVPLRNSYSSVVPPRMHQHLRFPKMVTSTLRKTSGLIQLRQTLIVCQICPVYSHWRL